jgi:hypothetical protein
MNRVRFARIRVFVHDQRQRPRVSSSERRHRALQSRQVDKALE